jgi:hypothetical protein
MSNSTHTPSSGLAFSFNEFNNLVTGVEMLYALARRLSLAVQNQMCEYLIQEAAMAFTKTMLSLLGFLRFLPSSFYAKEGEFVIDISSASVMARQVMEDTISLFYLSERGLTRKQKEFREAVWRYHGAREAIRSAGFGNKSHPHLPAADAKLEPFEQYFAEPETREMLNSIKRDDQGRIIKADKNHVLHDHEILERRGIQTDVYDLGRKVLSNFAHFSALSHQMMMETNADWGKSWRPFVPPTEYAANFAAESIEAFLETFPQTRQLLSEHERTLVANCRSWPPGVV